MPAKKKYKLLLNSTEERFGGSGAEVPAEITAKKEPCCFKDYSIVLDLPPYSALIYAF